MSVSVVIVAAGRGLRLGGDVPKQLLEISGRSLLQRSVAAFDAHPETSEIVVVLPPDLVGNGAALVGATTRPIAVVGGGAHRHESVRAGVARTSIGNDVVLIHDAARPFVDGPLIDRVIAATRAGGAAIPAMPARDTVKRVDLARHAVVETIPRDTVWMAQTPQGFRRAVLADAMAAGATNGEATDEGMLAERAGHVVHVVAGDARNVKITTAEDLAQARAAVAAAPSLRIGTGYDLHRLVEGRPLVLAGVVLPSGVGPLGHSDGDVVCHALVDALFGAAGAGDIGQHFPNTEPRWKDAPGLDLLRRAVDVLRDLGWTTSNVDVTVVLERPKMLPHIPAIRARLAEVLGLEASAVSVKAKTNEGVDAVGRGEAIASHAVAMIARGVAS